MKYKKEIKKAILILFFCGWGIFCLINILANCAKYDFWDWVIILLFVGCPYFIFALVKRKAKTKLTSHEETPEFKELQSEVRQTKKEKISVPREKKPIERFFATFGKVVATIFCSFMIGGACLTSFGFFLLSKDNQDARFLAINLGMGVLFAILLYLIWRKPKYQSKLSSTNNPTISQLDQLYLLDDYDLLDDDQISEHIIPQLGVKITTWVEDDLPPKEVLSSMRTVYSLMQAQSDMRILQDSIDLIKKTRNLDTFFSRASLAMRKVYTLRQAEQAKIKGVSGTKQLKNEVFQTIGKEKERVLVDSLQYEKSKIDALSTVRAKVSHWKKLPTVIGKI